MRSNPAGLLTVFKSCFTPGHIAAWCACHLRTRAAAVPWIQRVRCLPPAGSTILSCSADKTIRGWDAETGAQIKRLRGHDGIVNSCCPLRRGPPLVVSGSDDGSVRIWDMRLKRPVANMDAGGFPVTAVAFGAAGDEVYSGGLDNDIKVGQPTAVC